MKKSLVSLALGAFLALIPTSFALAHEGNSAAMQSSPQAELQPFDIQYLDTMAEHHREGIKMFQMAVDKSENDEIKSMAQKMVDDQKKEIPELENMREKIKANAPEAINMKLPGMKPMDMMDMSKLKAASGTEFDRMFLDMTIQHHQSAVAMADTALEKAKNKIVREKAQEIHDKQKAEIAKMKDMRQRISS